MLLQDQLPITPNAPIPTWFGIGGSADRLAHPRTPEELRRCLELDSNLRILGDGANLLVDDSGIAELVIVLDGPPFTSVTWDDKTGLIRAGAGAELPQLITESVRRGLSGIEGLAGIPATLGGAAIMNAGGAFGQIADSITAIHALDRSGRQVTLPRASIPFDYRHSGLTDLIITALDLKLTPANPAPLRARLKEVMEYKSKSQPMADRSAGCVFKNPTLTHDIPDIGASGQRISAGMLIDRAGCKGLAVRGASVSPRHANFVVALPGQAHARDVIELMALVTRRVHDTFGVELHSEVVIWRRSA